MSNSNPTQMAIPSQVRSRVTFYVTQLINHAAALTQVQRVHGTGHILSLERIERMESIQSSFAKLNEIRQMAVKNKCIQEFIDLMTQASLPDLMLYGFMEADVPSWAHIHPVSELQVNVVVTGTPTDPDDEDLPGSYTYGVSLSRKAKVTDLTDHEKSEIAKAVLDEFHQTQGIEELDDFTIEVVLINGQTISECEEPISTGFVESVC